MLSTAHTHTRRRTRRTSGAPEARLTHARDSRRTRVLVIGNCSSGAQLTVYVQPYAQTRFSAFGFARVFYIALNRIA